MKKNVTAMNELEEQNFGLLLKRIISKCNLKALLFGENTEIVSDGKLQENQFILRIHTEKRKLMAISQESEYVKKLGVSKLMMKWISWET